MTFGVDDYEKAIARFFDTEQNVVGTGFLVASGYVLTCAHVVLQAIGISEDEFAVYEWPPQELISLDFPILAHHQWIQAEVIAWLPYDKEGGDVAALKLRTSEPEDAQPIPLEQFLCNTLVKDQHFVYGFGDDVGGRSDAYRPKTSVAGARLQLCKVGNPNDETIEPGFSGAPVWNEVHQCVIGMVATVQDRQQHKAYAIPTEKLLPVLKQVDALYLHDVLMESLAACRSEDERERLSFEITTTLRRCNPNGNDRPWLEQFLDLSVDRAPALGWEAEGKLVYFVMMLALDEIPIHTYDRLKDWVKRCNLSFPDLLDRLTREMKQQKISSSNICEHLMVAVEQKGASTDELRVSLWAIPDRETYDPNNPPPLLVPEQILSISELPRFILEQIKKKLRKKPTPTIHLFMPRKLFGFDIEMQPIGDREVVLGSKYPFVIRTNLKTHPIGYYYYDDWHEKWEQLENAYDDKTDEVFKAVDCSRPNRDLIAELETISAAMLKECDSAGELFELISDETALPVALWSREPQFQDRLADVLDCVVKQFPHRIQQEREGACSSVDPKANPLLGHHLSLVWEDPKIVPPDMQFDPERC